MLATRQFATIKCLIIYNYVSKHNPSVNNVSLEPLNYQPDPRFGGTSMTNIPLTFLLVCSGTSLQEFELSRLNRIANLRKQLHIIQDELRQIEAEAMCARWLIEHRADLLSAGSVTVVQGEFEFAAQPMAITRTERGRKQA